MKQAVQPVSGGPVEVLDVPCPEISPTEVLVRTLASVISSGTERAVTALARSNLLVKARARPDLVRQVVRKARAEGIAATAQTVRSRLSSDVPLGYSASGLVTEVGAAVDGIATGQLVATGGPAWPATRSSRPCPACCARSCPKEFYRTTRRLPPSRPSRCTRCACRSRPGRQGRGAGARADRPACGAAGDGVGVRRGRIDPGEFARRPRRARASSRWTSPGTPLRNRSCVGPGGAARTRCSSAPPTSRPRPMSRAPGAVPGPRHRGHGGRRGDAGPAVPRSTNGRSRCCLPARTGRAGTSPPMRAGGSTSGGA